MEREKLGGRIALAKLTKLLKSMATSWTWACVGATPSSEREVSSASMSRALTALRDRACVIRARVSAFGAVIASPTSRSAAGAMGAPEIGETRLLS